MPWQNTADTRRRSDATYSTAEYKRKRLACLRRANWRCEIRIDGVCAGAASEADHATQAASDPQHTSLRAACKPCHRHITARQGGGWRGNRNGNPDPEPAPRTAW